MIFNDILTIRIYCKHFFYFIKKNIFFNIASNIRHYSVKKAIILFYVKNIFDYDFS